VPRVLLLVQAVSPEGLTVGGKLWPLDSQAPMHLKAVNILQLQRLLRCAPCVQVQRLQRVVGNVRPYGCRAAVQTYKQCVWVWGLNSSLLMPETVVEVEKTRAGNAGGVACIP
jgi:hypothetical protein